MWWRLQDWCDERLILLHVDPNMFELRLEWVDQDRRKWQRLLISPSAWAETRGGNRRTIEWVIESMIRHHPQFS